MLKKIILFAFFALTSIAIYSQRPSIELTFTAIDSADHLQLDSIKVMNRTQAHQVGTYQLMKNLKYWKGLLTVNLELGTRCGDLAYDSTWEFQGYDAGLNLKSLFYWNQGDASDKYGYSGLPAGAYYEPIGFYDLGDLSAWWAADVTNDDKSWGHVLGSNSAKIGRQYHTVVPTGLLLE